MLLIERAVRDTAMPRVLFDVTSGLMAQSLRTCREQPLPRSAADVSDCQTVLTDWLAARFSRSALMLGLALSGPASAQLMVADDFNNYSNGNLSGQGSWITSNSTNLVFNVSDSNPIPYGCYNGGNGGRYVTPGAGGVPYSQRLRYPTTNFVASTDQTLFVSALVRPTAAGSNSEAHLIGLGNDFGGTNYEFLRVHLRAATGGVNFGISKGNGAGLTGDATGGIVWGSTVYPLNATYLVVARYVFDNGGGASADSIHLWVNPATDSAPSEATATAIIGPGAGGNDILFDSDNVRNVYLSSREQGGISPAFLLDGLRYARGASAASAWTNLDAGLLPCQQTTTTTINSDQPDASLVGQAYTVDVTVAGQSTSPSGTITVSDGMASCGPVNLVPSVAPNSVASCQLTSLTAGSKVLTAMYTPSSGAFAGSIGTDTHQVNPANTAVSVAGPARARINTAATYTITLSALAPGGGTPAIGTVTVSAGSNSCTITLPASACDLSFASLGSRTISASFSGNANYLASTSSGPGDAGTLVFAQSDLQVTKDNGQAFYGIGGLQVYTIQLRNVGPDVARNLRLQDAAPPELANVQWSCAASGGAICPQSAGSGSIDQMIAEIAPPEVLTYTLSGTVVGSSAQISNTASVQLPSDTTIEDANTGNNDATDVDQLSTLFRDGFEVTSVSAASGSFLLPSTALRGAVDRVAVSVFGLDDRSGNVLRVYARVLNGEIEYALATREPVGREPAGWDLGSWRRFSGDPTLRWTATPEAEGWRLLSAILN
ncbi:hypothetical protein C7S18_09555 [Ahniella affigens]|uniref:Uncharacterized protein n=1 Tax=Ahniella affigens TaxID=2021234 RepID=A0A2P1PRG5_9GAMM|nr:Ig-like domain repeat protein [Ahniella affigens]AVP97425.1 hypothetical protein C7S18_09555 [Ahniella affigens]